jgi:tape measure domain-containing protein
MTTDTYSIQVAVDSTSAVTATRNLTAMEQATGRSERALSSLGSVAKIAGSALAGISIASLARDILKINIEFENMRAQLLSVTGSSVMAAKAMADIQKISRETPQSLQEITKSYMMLKNFGIEPTIQVMRDLTNITSKVGGDSDTLSGIIRQLGQAYAKNKLQAEDANSIIERGIPIYSLLSQVTGKTTSEVLKMMEAGKITRPVIEDLIHAMGSSAVDASANKMQTLGGKVDMLGEAWHNFEDVLLNDKASGILGNIVSGMIKSIDYLTERFGTSVGKQIADLEVSVAAAKKNIPENKNSASYAAANESYMQQQIMLDQLKRQKQLADAEASTTTEKIKNDKNIQKSQDETIRLRDLEIKRVKEFGTATQQENQALKEAKDTYGEVTASMKEQIHQKYFHKDITAAQTKLTKEESAAKKEAAKATKDLAEAERYFNEQLNAQVASAENAGKLFAAQQQTKIAALEAERVSISDKAAIEYESAKTYEEKSRILNESQSATNLLLAKEKEIRDSLTNQSAETIDAKIAAAQAELDNAGKYNLTLAEQLRLKTEIAGLQTDKAVLAETSTQSDIKAKSDAEQKYNDDKLASIKAISDAQTSANTAASAQMDILTANLETAKEAATGLADAFGSVGGAVGGLGVALASYEKSQAAITDGLQNQLFEIQKLNDGKGDQAKADKAIATASQKQSQLQIKSYGDMAAAAQGFFKKGTTGYQVLGAATKVFRAFEMAQSAMSMVRMIADNGAKVGAYITGLFTSTAANAASVAPNVAADAAKATASGTAAVASASAAPFPIGFATGAAMLAFMLAIGVAMAGGGGSSAPQMSGADYQKAQSEKYNETIGGTVLGSSDASKSIINALDIISANSTVDLDYSKGMAESLQKLTYSIDNVTASVAQQMDFGRNGVSLAGSSKTTGVFGSAGGGIGGFAIGTAISNLVMPFLGLILGAFTTVTKITKQFAGSGFKFMDELYSSVVKNGTTSVQQYIDILVTETKSSFFGLVSSSKQWITTKYKPIEERVKEAFTDTILGIGNSIIKTADLLGQSTATLTDQVNNFNVELGRIPMERTNYKGKGSRQKNQENATINEERLNAAFEKLSDQMAMLSPQFLESQKIQEGYYQTLMRVTVAISTANTKLKAMGINAIEYSDIVEKRGDIEKQMIVQSLQLASAFTDVNDIVGKLPGTADDIIEAFNGLNSIKTGLAAIGASGLTLSQDLINVAGGISAFSSTLSDFAKSMLSPEKLANASASKMQENLWSLGFINMPKLTSNAQDAIDVYKYIVQEAAKDTTEAGNYILTKLILMGSDFAAVAEESAKYVTDATTEINANIKKEQDLIVKSTDQRINILKKLGELDPAAKEEALRIEREKAMQGMDGATASYTQALNMLTDAMAELSAATTELNTAYKALTAMRDKYSTIATTLKSYLDELNGTASDYDNARTLFLKTSKLAKSGNEQALQDMTSVSKAFLSASKTRSDDATKAIQETVNTAKTALQNAYNSLVSLRDKFKGISQSLKDYKSEITGAGTPQGSPESVYQSTKKAFEDANILAASGNEQALTNLPNTAKAFLDASLKYNATGANYQTDYQSVLVALDKATGASDSQIDILTKQLTAAESADNSLVSIDGTALSIDEAIKQYQSALAEQSGIDTTRYEEDKALVAQNVSDALAKTNEQIDLMTKQLTTAETANTKLEDLKTKTDTVDGSISRLSTAVNDYISADLTFSNALAMNKTLLTDLSDVIKQSEINIINQQAAATAAAASAAAAQAQAMAIAAQDAASLRAANMNMNYSVDSINPVKPLDLNASYNQAPSTISDIVSAITLSNAMSDITVKPYANGGMASGLSLVGEQGAELVNFTSPANVTSHQQTTGLFDSIGNAIDDQSVLLKEQVIELKALVNLQSSANIALINEMKGMKEELNTISRKAKLEAAA